MWALVGIPKRLRWRRGCRRMSCEDYEDEEVQKIVEERRTVLDIVRRILRDRTDWVAQGEVLMEAIVTEVEKLPVRPG
jgi:hypothetical protein